MAKIKLSKQATVDNDIAFNNKKITGLAEGTLDDHAVNKGQMDSAISTATNAIISGDLIGAMMYKGTYNASTNKVTISGSTQDIPTNSKLGWFFRVTTNGTSLGQTWELGDYLVINKDLSAAPTSTDVDRVDNTDSDKMPLTYLDTTTTLAANSDTKVPSQKAVKSYIDTAVAAKLSKNTAITGATKTKITYDANGLVTAGADLAEADIPALSISKITNLTTTLSGKADASALTAHTGNTSNPHSVTKAQIGLGNVDNTSDANKPISTATQTALDGKANTSHTHTAAQITDLTATINGKIVPKKYFKTVKCTGTQSLFDTELPSNDASMKIFTNADAVNTAAFNVYANGLKLHCAEATAAGAATAIQEDVDYRVNIVSNKYQIELKTALESGDILEIECYYMIV